MKNGGTEERKIKKKMRAAGMGRGAKKKKTEQFEAVRMGKCHCGSGGGAD